ncbi:MAG: hypothetical protein LBE12_09230, partial [Planctomycetaceae bacterium]|nr:hypothetical protein [Planctomycetaceae bacterium]
MPQADYYPNGNNSACDTIHYQLSTLHYSMLPFQGLISKAKPYVGRCPTLLLIAPTGRIGKQFFDSKTKIPLIY